MLLGVALALWLAVALPLRVDAALPEGEAPLVRLEVGEPDREALRLPVLEGVPEAVPLPLGVQEALGVAEAEAAAVRLPLPVPLPLPLPLAPRDRLLVGEEERLLLRLLLLLGLTEEVPVLL